MDMPTKPEGGPGAATPRDFSRANLKVLGGCLLGAFCAPPVLMISAVAVVMAPLGAEFGWSRAQISGAVTLMLFLSALFTAVWGGLIDRRGVRVILSVGTAGVGFSVLMLGFTPRSLIYFYLGFCGLALTGSTAVGYSKVIGALFSRNRGKALAVFGMESTLVGAFMPALLFGLLKLYGWRGMFVGVGVIILLIAPLLLWLLREPRGPDLARETSRALGGLTGVESRRTRAFWFLNFATMSGNLTATGLLPHLVGLALSRGMPAGVAVAALSLQTVAIALGQVVGGYTLDRVDSPKIAVPFAALAFAGLGAMALAQPSLGGAPLFLTGAAVLGFGNGAKRSMNTYFQSRFFGLKALAANAGWSLAITSFVLAPAPLLFGAIYDRTKSYDLALVIVGAGLVVALGFYLALPSYRYTVAGAEPAMNDAEAAEFSATASSLG